MPTIDWSAFLAVILSAVTGVFNTVVSTLKKSYEDSHKWFAIGCIIFAALVWFGYAHLTIPAKNADLERQVTELTLAVRDLKSSVDGLKAPAPVVTGSIKKKSK